MYSCQKSVDQILPNPESEEKSWGSVTVLDYAQTEKIRTITRKVHIRAGQEVKSRCEKDFAQSWTVLEGSAELTLGWELKFLQFGDSIQIPSNVWYSLRAVEDFWMMQVWTGISPEAGKDQEPE